MKAAMEQQMWTKGPSFPKGIPDPSVEVRPITLAPNILILRYSGRTTPLKITFISGRPDPTACGATKCVKPTLNNNKHTDLDCQYKV